MKIEISKEEYYRVVEWVKDAIELNETQTLRNKAVIFVSTVLNGLGIVTIEEKDDE